MRDEYFDKHEYYIDKLWFHHRGNIYRGNGVLSWGPEKGFHLVAKILEGSRPSKIEVKSIEIVRPLRVMLEITTTWGRNHLMTPPLRLRDSDLHFNHSFTLNFGRALFFHDIGHKNPASEDKWSGSAMYEVSEKLRFPDALHKEAKLGEKPFGRSFSRTGFDYEGENGEYLSGEISERKYIYFDWSLPKEKWSKGNSWQFAEALQDALSIVSGNITRLRYHEAYRGNRITKEYNSNGESKPLGVVFQLFDFNIVPKELVGALAFYLSEKSEGEFIIRKMLWQIVDAANQNSYAGQALLLSTVLEASLRTLYNIPFIPGRPSRDDPFNPSKVLEQFQFKYLSGKYDVKWKKKIEDILEAYKRLRHRYAHPDWITTQDGMLSDSEIAQLIDDMILLSRFYGYMILALASIKDLEPKFPIPFSNWGPIMTMETGSEKTKNE